MVLFEVNTWWLEQVFISLVHDCFQRAVQGDQMVPYDSAGIPVRQMQDQFFQYLYAVYGIDGEREDADIC